MARAGIVALVVAALLGCHARVAPRGDGGRCTRLQAVRQVRGVTLCEDAWSCERPPGGATDRVGLRRLAPCDATEGPILLYLPGMHMNAELPLADPRHDLRIYLAQAGIRTWGLDYRTHALARDASEADLGRWNAETFLDDAAWAVAFVHGAERGPLVLAGFSFGGTLAYRVTARAGGAAAGLIVLDAVPAPTRDPREGPAVIDVGSSRLPFPQRRRLLETVIADPAAASPVGGYASAAAALGDLLFTSPSFGGNGGLSAARDGVSDIQVVARLLASYDRWWPRDVLDASAPTPPRPPLRVLAFASTNRGSEWVEQVRAGARAWGGSGADLRELPGFGHLDVLVGRTAPYQVFEPIRRWLLALAG